jgi:hypothetical protein
MNPQTSSPASTSQAVPASGDGADYRTRPISRFLVISLLKTALKLGEIRFARRLALSWVTSFPGDAEIGLLHAQALMQFHSQGSEKGSISGSVTHYNKQALPILEAVCQSDPENVEALETIVRCRRAAGMDVPQEMLGSLLALGGRTSIKGEAPAWSRLLRQSRQALACGQFEMAEQLVHQVLLAEPPTPLPSVTHLLIGIQRGLPVQSIHSLAELYHERWPNCVQFILILANALLELGEPDRGVELLHQAVASDVSGQVAERLWGSQHQYQTLWLDQLELTFPHDLKLPHNLAAEMGWNQLSASAINQETLPQTEEIKPVENAAAPTQPTKSSSTPVGNTETSPDDIQSPFFETDQGISDTVKQTATTPPVDQGNHKTSFQTYVPEALRSIQDELERVALNLKQPHLAKGDGRFPVYVVLSSRQALEAQYGKQEAQALHAAMLDLVEAVKSRKEWGAILFYADEGSDSGDSKGSTLPSTLGIKPARSGDPWSIKLALADLDQCLTKNGEMVGALLIVGGPEIIPFHHLPNPVDDVDLDVPSDNPYGTRDDNYFVPEWPVGRLPGGTAKEAQPLVDVLQEYADRHKQASRHKPWYTRWWEIIFNLFRADASRVRPNLGYTAAIWQQASLSVFQPIGEARSMLVSPPIQVKTDPDSLFTIGSDGRYSPLINHLTQTDVALGPARLAYFNLHGMSDAAEWFGQCDPHDSTPGAEYPVALRPQDLSDQDHRSSESNNGNKDSIPAVVFSEACFGAHITGKSVNQAISLTFLAHGTQVVVGSTCTVYGSISAPLAAADLLGYAFWSCLSEGYSAGEALRLAKIQMASEMHRRQGYLDGEDQKTLISFVLYGDPLAQTLPVGKQPKAAFRTLKPPDQVKTVCDRSEGNVDEQPPGPEVMDYVKHIVSQYLPGMADAKLSLTQEHASCQGEAHSCPTAQIGSKGTPSQTPQRKVVTLSKQVQRGSGLHQHYARLTLDSQGKLVKLVVSR